MADRTVPDAIPASDHGKPPTDSARVNALLSEIVGLANNMDGLYATFPGCLEHIDAAANLIVVMRDALCRIGWMADLALVAAGELQDVGDAEEWLLSPRAQGRPSRHHLPPERVDLKAVPNHNVQP